MPTKNSRSSSPWPHWVLFAMAVALVAAFLAFAPRLSQLGFSRPVFYIVLVPLGLASAAFLKQALNATTAAVNAQLSFGTVQLGGPVAVFALVVGAGVYLLPAEQEALELVVRIPEMRDVDLSRAQLVLFAGPRDIHPESTGRTSARFLVMPRYRSAQFRFSGVIPGYDIDDKPFEYPSNGVHSLTLIPQTTVVTGTVVGPDGKPLDKAKVVFERGLVVADTEMGSFRAVLPRPPGTSVHVEVRYHDQVGYRGDLSTPNVLSLRWEPP